VHKTLEDANIKLGSVATDVRGKSGRAMLRALLAGERDPARLADLALGRLREKIPALREALAGRPTEHHVFLLGRLLGHLEYLEGEIEAFGRRIDRCLRPLLTADRMRRLDRVPGVNRRTVENVVAEIGTDMGQYPDEAHLSSWAGLCPGHEESAGKRSRSRTTKGNRWLRRALTEAAWAASHAKHSYLGKQYRRLAARRGKKRALVAVGHSLLVIFYHLLRADVEYADLGEDYLERLKPDRSRRYLVKRLEALGYEVTLTPTDQAA
jgi:transposase